MIAIDRFHCYGDSKFELVYLHGTCIFSCPSQPAHMDRLYVLLSLLTTGMHDVHPDSKVIWYDSVTVVGDLKWQNKLNDFNE